MLQQQNYEVSGRLEDIKFRSKSKQAKKEEMLRQRAGGDYSYLD